jgi:hypothetical protein
LIDTDIIFTNGYTAITAGLATSNTIDYSIADVPAGTYFFYCFVDMDCLGSGATAGDYLWVYGASSVYTIPTLANCVVPSSGVVSFDFSAFTYYVASKWCGYRPGHQLGRHHVLYAERERNLHRR